MRVRQSLSLRSHSRSGIGSNNVAMGTTLGSYGVALALLHDVAVEVDQHEVVASTRSRLTAGVALMRTRSESGTRALTCHWYVPMQGARRFAFMTSEAVW